MSSQASSGATGAVATTTPTPGNSTKSLTITQPLLPLTPPGQTIDSVEVTGFDSGGNQIYDSKVDVGLSMQFAPIPVTVVRMQIDYLRNRGYSLLRSVVNVGNNATSARAGAATNVVTTSTSIAVNNPTLQTAHDVTKFYSVSDGNGGFKLMYTLNGGPPKQIRLKGMAYSPAPINNDVNKQLNIADYFWDTFTSGPATIYNWFALWGSGQLGGTNYSARGDIEAIRAMNANCIRVYSLIAKQVPAGSYPADYSSAGTHYTHQQFLDTCWNNGQNPIFVLADLAMPDQSVNNTIPVTPNEVSWWEANLKQSVTDVNDHPAIFGFDLWNEQDTGPIASPTAPTAASDFFYSQNKKYADTVKTIAPDKMVGWALHDFPTVPYFLSTFGPTDGSFAKYGDMLSSFDFWGINTYQTQTLDPVLAPHYPIPGGMTYADLPVKYQKPVLFTEFGWSAAGHDQNGALYTDTTTDQNTAKKITQMYGLAYGANKYPKMFIGAMYFEFCDEWWKQTNLIAWDPSNNPDSGFPNGYNDQEAYGLYAIKPGPGQSPSSPVFQNNGPVLPVNTLVARNAAIQALIAIYKNN